MNALAILHLLENSEMRPVEYKTKHQEKVEAERQDLFLNSEHAEFVPFTYLSSGYTHSPLFFKHLTKRFYHPGGFAPSPVQSSGVVGQGTLL